MSSPLYFRSQGWWSLLARKMLYTCMLYQSIWTFPLKKKRINMNMCRSASESNFVVIYGSGAVAVHTFAPAFPRGILIYKSKRCKLPTNFRWFYQTSGVWELLWRVRPPITKRLSMWVLPLEIDTCRGTRGQHQNRMPPTRDETLSIYIVSRGRCRPAHGMSKTVG